jgi:sensor histidine kinase regulating citrate/malate metabolism
MAGRTKQRGISFFTVIFIMAVLAAVGLVAVQAFPSVIEYQAALKAINKAKEGATVAEVRSIFDKAADIDSISSLKGRDLEIAKEGDQVVISFAYDKEFHLFGPAWLVLKYRGTSRPGR